MSEPTTQTGRTLPLSWTAGTLRDWAIAIERESTAPLHARIAALEAALQRLVDEWDRGFAGARPVDQELARELLADRTLLANEPQP